MLYGALVESSLPTQIIPLLIIIGKNIWEYWQILKEEKELRQTRARASEEVAFDNLDEPGQIEMEAVVKQDHGEANKGTPLNMN